MKAEYDFSKLCIVIPALDPDQALVQIVQDLLKANYWRIIVVNDGSMSQCHPIFQTITPWERVQVLQHESNQGKGAALKTGFKWIRDHHPDDLQGVVTVDADGQHLIKDIFKVSQNLLEQPHSFILGVRDFSQNIPFRSRFGNQLTRRVFKYLHKYDIHDTQTGLRGIPFSLFKTFIELDSNHYEFEMQCLLHVVEKNLSIKQVDIDTVYIDNNRGSHFNPFIDSLRIYFVFLRFMVISALSFLLDIGIFIFLHLMGLNLFTNLLVARFCSSFFNFYNNKVLVYKCKGSERLNREIVGYCLLAVAIFLFSYVSISFLVLHFGLGIVMSKIIIDAFLFLFSFYMQRRVIFVSE